MWKKIGIVALILGVGYGLMYMFEPSDFNKVDGWVKAFLTLLTNLFN